MGQIDLTPTPAAYIRMLKIIASSSTKAADRAWAKGELAKIGVE